MTQNFLDHPLGRHLLTCTRCLHVNLNLSLLAFAVVTLYLTVTAYTGFNHELDVYYNYEPINVIVISGCACALVIGSLLGIYSSIALSRDGFAGNATILVLVIVGTTGYSAWRTIMHDYSKTSKLFKQLNNDIDKYGLHEDFIDTIQRAFSCCGAEGFNDWVQNIPLSCCPGIDAATNKAAVGCEEDSPSLNKKGCFDSLAKMLSYYNWIILISVGLLNAMQTVVVTLSYILCRTVQKTRKKDTLEAPEPKLEPEPEPQPEPEVESAPEATPEPGAVPEPETETVKIPPPPPLPEPVKVETPQSIPIQYK